MKIQVLLYSVDGKLLKKWNTKNEDDKEVFFNKDNSDVFFSVGEKAITIRGGIVVAMEEYG